jgi:RND family efflux transporter MFP subunit
MTLKYLLPLLAIIGVAFAAFNVVNSNKPMPVAKPAVEPSFSPYKNFIAGSGIIEAQDKNISLGTPLSGIVTKVAVKVGDKVNKGEALFYLDDRDTRAKLAVNSAELAKARADVDIAKAQLDDSKIQNALIESITDKRAISKEELLKRQNAVLIAKARLESAKAQVLQVESMIQDTRTTLERLVVHAPISGEMLQVNIRQGEFAQAGLSITPLILLGNLDKLHVRVDIDENDAWRFNENSKAIAYLRGNRNFKVDLIPAYIEPFVVPKRSLTGDSTERVDTRVLQVIYSFDANKLPAYVGQQMDVFIDQPDGSGKDKSGL